MRQGRQTSLLTPAGFGRTNKKAPTVTSCRGFPKRVKGTASEQGYIITFLPFLPAIPSASAARKFARLNGRPGKKHRLACTATKTGISVPHSSRTVTPACGWGYTEHLPAPSGVTAGERLGLLPEKGVSMLERRKRHENNRPR